MKEYKWIFYVICAILEVIAIVMSITAISHLLTEDSDMAVLVGVGICISIFVLIAAQITYIIKKIIDKRMGD